MSKSRAKGTRAETAVVDYLRPNGFPYAERRALNGNKDRGDVAGVISTVLEVKDCREMALASWVRELEQEMANDGARYGAVIHKRRGKGSPADWYATMPVSALLVLLRDALGVSEQAA